MPYELLIDGASFRLVSVLICVPYNLISHIQQTDFQIFPSKTGFNYNYNHVLDCTAVCGSQDVG